MHDRQWLLQEVEFERTSRELSATEYRLGAGIRARSGYGKCEVPELPELACRSQDQFSGASRGGRRQSGGAGRACFLFLLLWLRSRLVVRFCVVFFSSG